MTNKEKYDYGMDRALILDTNFDPITDFVCGTDVLCPTFFGYVSCKITNEYNLWAESDNCFYSIEKKDDLYKLSFYSDKNILKSEVL